MSLTNLFSLELIPTIRCNHPLWGPRSLSEWSWWTFVSNCRLGPRTPIMAGGTVGHTVHYYNNFNSLSNLLLWLWPGGQGCHALCQGWEVSSCHKTPTDSLTTGPWAPAHILTSQWTSDISTAHTQISWPRCLNLCLTIVHWLLSANTRDLTWA